MASPSVLRFFPLACLLFAVDARGATILCSSVSGQSLASIAMTGSCSIGDLTYSDFVYQFTPTADSPATPSPSTDISVDFMEITDNLTADPFGTVGTATNPLYQVIFNFSGGNVVGANQAERYIIQYLVTDNVSGMQIVQVDNNIAGGATVDLGASGALTAKSMCDGGPFLASGGTPTGVCSAGAGNVYASVAPGGSQFLSNPDAEADSSILYNAPSQKFGGFIGSSNFGVYDQADISGGTSSPAASASVTQIENDFLEAAASSGIATPEPAAFWTTGLSLVAFCVGRAALLRRRNAPQRQTPLA